MSDMNIGVVGRGKTSPLKYQLDVDREAYINAAVNVGATNPTEETEQEKDERVKAINEKAEQFDSYSIPEEPDSYGTSFVDNSEPNQLKKDIDFESADFEQTQKLLNNTAQLKGMRLELDNVRKQKHEIAAHSFQNLKNVSLNNEEDDLDTPEKVIQYHLDKWSSADNLNHYLEGAVTDKKIKDRINSFFEHPVTHEVLTTSNETITKTEGEELQFKRGLLIYFKQNDDYIAKIDEEVKKLDEATAELTNNINEALNFNSNTLYRYVQFLIERSEKPTDVVAIEKAVRKRITEDEEWKAANGGRKLKSEAIEKKIKKETTAAINDDARRKSAEKRKAKAIRSAYTLENMIELVESKPSIIENSLKDFRNDDKIRAIGERYRSKLKTAHINLNLAGFLSDDPKDSLEYKVIPLDEYPAGLEGFTVFFIIRSLSMSLSSKEDEVFHSAIYITLGQIINNQMDEDTAGIMKESIRNFLSHFEGK